MNLPKEKFGYQKLIIYQKAIELVLLVYKITAIFPKEEQFVLVPQIRRATISIPSNIVEGYSKKSTREYLRYLKIAIGSASELRVHFEIAFRLKYFNEQQYSKTGFLLDEVLKLLYSYQKSLGEKIKIE